MFICYSFFDLAILVLSIDLSVSFDRVSTHSSELEFGSMVGFQKEVCLCGHCMNSILILGEYLYSFF